MSFLVICQFVSSCNYPILSIVSSCSVLLQKHEGRFLNDQLCDHRFAKTYFLWSISGNFERVLFLFMLTLMSTKILNLVAPIIGFVLTLDCEGNLRLISFLKVMFSKINVILWCLFCLGCYAWPETRRTCHPG